MPSMTEEPDQGRGALDLDEDEVDDIQYKHAKDAILFMIDVNQSMISPGTGSTESTSEDSALIASLKCAYELMTMRIIASPNDMMGVLLHGVERGHLPPIETDDDAQEAEIPTHDYLLVDVCIPSASDVKRLKDFSEYRSSQTKAVQSSSQKFISNTLFYASNIFTSRAGNFASRRLFIITDNDSPQGEDDRLKALATQRARDLFDLGITIELFPIVQPGQVFDRTKFYNDITYSDPSSDPEAPMPISVSLDTSHVENSAGLLNSLMTSIKSRVVPKRALFANLPLELSPMMKISVKGYVIFKRQAPKRTSYVWLHGDQAQIATGQSASISDETGHNVTKPEIRKAFKFGGEQVSFSEEELGSIRDFGEAGIRVIGFQAMNQDSLPIWANFKAGTFLYPSEEGYVGSTRVFAALRRKMLDDNKMTIVWFIARRNAVPQLAAIVPGIETSDDGDLLTLPPGLWLIPRPFADDIRGNPDTLSVTPPDALVDKMRQVIQQLQLPRGLFQPAKYPNPTLQWHYRVLQAMALEEEAPTDREDKTVPKYRQVSKRAGHLVQEWGAELMEQHRVWEANNRILLKRPAAATSGSEASSKRQKQNSPGDLDDDSIGKLYNENKISKLTVADLKWWLSSKGLSTSGKKADMIERITLWYESK